MAESLYGLGQELRPYEQTWRDKAPLWLLGNNPSDERKNFVSGLVGSRGAGEGSRNYVVFDDKLIDILKKYGLPIPVAGAAFEGMDQQPSP